MNRRSGRGASLAPPEIVGLASKAEFIGAVTSWCEVSPGLLKSKEYWQIVVAGERALAIWKHAARLAEERATTWDETDALDGILRHLAGFVLPIQRNHDALPDVDALSQKDLTAIRAHILKLAPLARRKRDPSRSREDIATGTALRLYKERNQKRPTKMEIAALMGLKDDRALCRDRMPQFHAFWKGLGAPVPESVHGRGKRQGRHGRAI